LRNFLLSLIFIAMINGCGNSSNSNLDGRVLLEQKCAKCHNLEMPPKTFENEVAPPMMTVTIHLKDFMDNGNKSDVRYKFIDFVTNYVINPSRDKAYCDKKSLDTYGVMPSQKGKVTKDEARAVAEHIYDRYDNKILLKIMKEKARLRRLPKHIRIFEEHQCNICHKLEKDTIAPSFKSISNKYTLKDKEHLINSIKNGSKGNWSGFAVPMKGYLNELNATEINIVVDWLLNKK